MIECIVEVVEVTVKLSNNWFTGGGAVADGDDRHGPISTGVMSRIFLFDLVLGLFGAFVALPDLVEPPSSFFEDLVILIVGLLQLPRRRRVLNFCLLCMIVSVSSAPMTLVRQIAARRNINEFIFHCCYLNADGGRDLCQSMSEGKYEGWLINAYAKHKLFRACQKFELRRDSLTVLILRAKDCPHRRTRSLR